MLLAAVLLATILYCPQQYFGAVGATPMEAQPQRSEQANRYAEVVRAVNKVLVTGSQDQFDAVNGFLAACPEEDNGQHAPVVQSCCSPCVACNPMPPCIMDYILMPLQLRHHMLVHQELCVHRSFPASHAFCQSQPITTA